MSKALSSKLTAPLASRFSRGLRSHTAYGEDLVLAQIFQYQPPGTYVDVGAAHPYDESLTHHLHLAGWSGYNIDARAGAIEMMQRARPHDHHLVAAIGAPSTQSVFVEFETGSLSSVDPDAIARWTASGLPVAHRSPVRLRGLADVFGELGVPARFELLNVDIEGLDEAALKSNDWDAFRPTVICVEDPLAALGGPSSTPIGRLLVEQGYERLAALPNTSIFAEPAIVERLVRQSGNDPDVFFHTHQIGAHSQADRTSD